MKRASLHSTESSGEMSPHIYRLCSKCADRLVPPRGWALIDQRDRVYSKGVSMLLELRSVGDETGAEDSRVAFGHGA